MKSELENSVSGTKGNQFWSIVVQLCVCVHICMSLCVCVCMCLSYVHLSHSLWTTNIYHESKIH